MSPGLPDVHSFVRLQCCKLLVFAVLLAPVGIWAKTHPSRAGAVGHYSRGALRNGIPMPLSGSDHYLLFPAKCSGHANHYGHKTVVAATRAAAGRVRKAYPKAPRIPVGDLSHRRGGPIPHHLSHQNGLDVDVYFLRRQAIRPCAEPPSYERRDPATGRWEVAPDFVANWNWTLAASFARNPGVKTIFIGGLLKRHLGRWAKRHGVSKRERRLTMKKLHAVYCRPPRGIKMDTYRGNLCPHDDHIHVRFHCPRDSKGCRAHK
jgi:penicillin-insensitive murein endopeptidase